MTSTGNRLHSQPNTSTFPSHPPTAPRSPCDINLLPFTFFAFHLQHLHPVSSEQPSFSRSSHFQPTSSLLIIHPTHALATPLTPETLFIRNNMQNSLIPSTSPPTRRPLLLALLIYALYHHKPLLTHIRSLIRTAHRFSNSIHIISHLLSVTTSDLQAYIHPPPLRRLPPTTIPRSIRRILRLAATPDGLAILQTVAGGVTKEAIYRGDRPMERGLTGDGVGALLDALAKPSGQAVVSNVVATAVREGVQAMNRGQENGTGKPVVEVVMDGVLSERGRGLVVDVVNAVVKAVVPEFLGNAQRAKRVGANSAGGVVGGEVVTPMGVTPIGSPVRRKRPVSFGIGAESPVSRQLVLSVMQAGGGIGVVERLALLAIRDKELVREVVRTVVGEAVRTYLKTQREMREEEDGGVDGNVETGREGLWKVIIMSAVVDLKRALLKIGREGSSGWVVF